MSERAVDPELRVFKPMMELAAALRQAKEAIIADWGQSVRELLPDADPLTTQSVRDTIPKVLDQFVLVLERADEETIADYFHLSRHHGASRFHQSFDIHELIVEYRLLRRIILRRMEAQMPGGLRLEHTIALGMGVDIALQQAVLEFVAHVSTRLRAETEARSKYLSFLSHDMRNNLNGVVLTMELLSRRLSREPAFADAVVDLRQLIRMVSQTVEGMERLLQSERLRSSTYQPKREMVVIKDLLEEVGGRYRARAEEKSMRIEVAAPLAAVIVTDQELVRLVLQNLVGNAVKYSRRGVVRLEAAGQGEEWTISVVDQGPGIAPEQLGKIFEAFTRGETHGQEGIGLGLSIASEAARALEARVSVESELGKGSTFRIHLKVRPPQEEGE